MTDGAIGAWSDAHLFEVVATPSREELARAVELVQRYLVDRPSDDPDPITRPVVGEAASADVGARPPIDVESAATLAGAMAAIRAELSETTGEQVGVVAVSHSPDGAGLLAANTDAAGADVVLDGSAHGALDTQLSESGVTVGGASFEIGNTTDDLTLDVGWHWRS